jgi:hypothetical protein
MPVELCQPNRTTLSGVIVAVLLSASGAFAGALEDAKAAFDRKDYATALRLFRPLAEQGNAEAQTALGTMYFRGYSVPRDEAEAEKWYLKAAEQGYVGGQWSLGFFYEEIKPPHHETEAAKWYRKAAEQGFAPAQAAVAVGYEYGLGVPQDFVLGHMWYNLAAAQNPAFANGRDKLAAKMSSEQIAEAQRLAREWKPTK